MFIPVIFVVIFLAFPLICRSDNVDTRLEKMEQMLHKMENENNELKNRVTMLEKTSKFDTDKVFSHANMTQTKNGVTIGEDVPSVVKRQTDEVKVAFHVVQSSTTKYGLHEIIGFDQIKLNVGNGYHSNSHIFDAPFSGVYVFTWTVVPEYWEYFQMELIVEDNTEGLVFADSDEIHDIHPATGVVVTRVNQGQHVYIRRGSNSNTYSRSSADQAKPSFSGWLLFQ